MLFNSYIFIFLFLPIAVLGYYGLHYLNKPKLALGFLIMMSMWFYGYNSIKYLMILITSILLNYCIVRLMDRMDNNRFRRTLLVAGVTLNIGILFLFKYYDFFIENVNAVLKTDFRFLQLVLPLGISFYTFQQLSYVIDSYRRECERYSLLEYAAYVSFFPQLIAGPIVYHDELIPQLRAKENHRINYENLSKGIYAFALGLAKKVLLADTFSPIVSMGYFKLGDLNATGTVILILCYSLQIYFDFSGYCDMAYGIGYLFNVELPVNFNSPYKSASISEFWDRWHMTLTRFFTKYVYIPFGGSRKGKIRTYVNIMIVFLISGIWHGANWTFILWGIINGAGKLFDRIFGRFFRWVPRIVRMVITFGFCSVAWSLFRAESVAQFRRILDFLRWREYKEIYVPFIDTFNDLIEVKFLYRFGFGGIIDACPWLLFVLFIVVCVLACFFIKNTQEKVADGKYTGKRMIVTTGLLLWSVMSLTGVSEFLYFNF